MRERIPGRLRSWKRRRRRRRHLLRRWRPKPLRAPRFTQDPLAKDSTQRTRDYIRSALLFAKVDQRARAAARHRDNLAQQRLAFHRVAVLEEMDLYDLTRRKVLAACAPDAFIVAQDFK